MAYGQIDPARLQGDALSRWYLRSPADIEQAQRDAAVAQYNDFFGGLDALRGASVGASSNDSPSSDESNGSQIASRLDPATRVLAEVGGGGRELRLDDGVYRPGQGNAKRISAATAWTCPTCHAGPSIPLPLPPQVQRLLPLFREIPNSFSGGAPDDRKQCDIQDRNDRRICGGQPRERDKAICHASASVRWKHCLRTGEVGEPSLDTAKRLQGR